MDKLCRPQPGYADWRREYAGLVLMVIFAGYESFVSRLDVEGQQERLSWMGQIGFGDLKLKLMASIVAISAIHLLEAFMNADHLTDRKLA